jgi:hypothetical protein
MTRWHIHQPRAHTSIPGVPHFDIRGFADSYQSIEGAINRNSILIGIVIPRNFGSDTAAGRGTSVQLLVDGSDSNKSGIALGYAESVVLLYPAQISLQKRPIMRASLRRRPHPRLVQQLTAIQEFCGARIDRGHIDDPGRTAHIAYDCA